MKKRERELFDRLNAHVAANADIRQSIVREMVNAAWDLIDGESWLECEALANALDLQGLVVTEIERLRCDPPRVHRNSGQRKPRI